MFLSATAIYYLSYILAGLAVGLFSLWFQYGRKGRRGRLRRGGGGGGATLDRGPGLVERIGLVWANRRPMSDRGRRYDGPQKVCGSSKTHNGHPCQNLRMMGKNHCHVHTPWYSPNRPAEEELAQRRRWWRDKDRRDREELERRERDERDRQLREERAEQTRIREQQQANDHAGQPDTNAPAES